MRDKDIPERLAVIETEMKNMGIDIKAIKDNHLNSIYKKFDDIWEKFNCFERKILNRLPGWVTVMITLLSSLVVGLIVYGVMRK